MLPKSLCASLRRHPSRSDCTGPPGDALRNCLGEPHELVLFESTFVSPLAIHLLPSLKLLLWIQEIGSHGSNARDILGTKPSKASASKM